MIPWKSTALLNRNVYRYRCDALCQIPVYRSYELCVLPVLEVWECQNFKGYAYYMVSNVRDGAGRDGKNMKTMVGLTRCSGTVGVKILGGTGHCRPFFFCDHTRRYILV